MRIYIKESQRELMKWLAAASPLSTPDVDSLGCGHRQYQLATLAPEAPNDNVLLYML